MRHTSDISATSGRVGYIKKVRGPRTGGGGGQPLLVYRSQPANKQIQMPELPSVVTIAQGL